MDNNKKGEKLIDHFDKNDERLTASWYLCSGQRMRYLKSIIKDKKSNFINFILLVIIIKAFNLSKLLYKNFKIFNLF